MECRSVLVRACICSHSTDDHHHYRLQQNTAITTATNTTIPSLISSCQVRFEPRSCRGSPHQHGPERVPSLFGKHVSPERNKTSYCNRYAPQALRCCRDVPGRERALRRCNSAALLLLLLLPVLIVSTFCAFGQRIIIQTHRPWQSLRAAPRRS